MKSELLIGSPQLLIFFFLEYLVLVNHKLNKMSLKTGQKHIILNFVLVSIYWYILKIADLQQIVVNDYVFGTAYVFISLKKIKIF